VSIQSSSPIQYRERVLPRAASLWSVLLILPATYLTLLPFSDRIGDFGGIGLGVLFTAVVLVSIWFASPVIEVDADGFAVGDAVLPLSVIAGYEIVDEAKAFAERGSNLDPRAYVRFQLSVNTLIKLQIDDPADKTPYWLIATRNPQAIVEAIQSYAA
jgi:hypothetical protein